ncbi:MAG: ImmA/IrrE family metallo-endopeptidase [Acidobacteria bacterium]|nr:ImmA/IrrE family metallo-endopeptidase [Acidobacteriota bacterium]
MNKAKIAAMARDLESAYNKGNIPVNLELIAEELGILVRHGKINNDVSGVIFKEGTETVIGINEGEPPERQRFTLSHEIGHFVLHRERDLCVTSQRLFRKPASGDFREMEANAFAAELLMPKQAIENAVLKLSADEVVSKVSELAKTFGVSEQAMTYRLANLQLFPMS